MIDWKRFAQRTSDFGPIRFVRDAAFRHRFANSTGMTLYHGFFRSFQEARAHAPRSKPIGYDNPDAANLYDERLARIFPSDYPVMFWLGRAFAEPSPSKNVLDIGGHVGVAYYQFEQYLEYPTDSDWRLGGDGRSGGRHAGPDPGRRARPRHLSFTTDLASVSDVSLLLAAGSLQYIDESLSTMIARYWWGPRHIILNKLPLHSAESFVTLQSIGTAFCPYRIFNRDEFIQSAKGFGYEVVDEWQNADMGCRIGSGSDRDIAAYSGLYFRRAQAIAS